MTQIETIIHLPDIRYVEIHCTCGTKVTLDMEKPHALAEKYGSFAPKECPGCRNDYDSAVRPSVDAFQKAYHSLLVIPKAVTFRGVSSREADAKA